MDPNKVNEDAMNGTDRFSIEGVTATVSRSIPTLEQFIALVKTRNLARTERFFATFSFPASDDLSERAKRLNDLTLLCEEALLPGKVIETRRLRINGLDEFRAHTVNYGEEITLQFLIDSDWTPRKAIEEWMIQCINPASVGREVGYYDEYKGTITLFALVQGGLPGSKIAAYSPTQADIGLTEALRDFTDGIPGSRTAIDRLMMRGRKTIDKLAAKAKAQTIGKINVASNPIFEYFRETETVAYTIQLIDCFPTNINVMPVSHSTPGVHKMSVTFSYKYWETLPEINAAALEEKALEGINSAISKQLRKLTNKITGRLSDLLPFR